MLRIARWLPENPAPETHLTFGQFGASGLRLGRVTDEERKLRTVCSSHTHGNCPDRLEGWGRHSVSCRIARHDPDDFARDAAYKPKGTRC
jgi:hypothetical protein